MNLRDEIDFSNSLAAEKQFRLSLMFGGIGLLFGGLVLGVVAIVFANRADRLGHRQAVVGKAIGIIDILANIVGIIIAMVYVAIHSA